MFAVVADIERYPEFVPGCTAIQILERETDGIIEIIKSKMLVAYGVFREAYTSKVTLNKIERTINAQHIDGPFHHLDTKWQFLPTVSGSEVKFSIDFAFKSRVLGGAASLVFDRMTSKMTDAFAVRAKQLYGASHYS